MAKINVTDPNFQRRQAEGIYSQILRYAELSGGNKELLESPDFRTLTTQYIQMQLQTTFMDGISEGRACGVGGLELGTR